MEMEVVVPIHNMDFDFSSARSSPMHLSPPRTPKGFGEFYCSAPTSPNRLEQFYREFDDFFISASKDGDSSSTATVPFDWEEKPGIPKSHKSEDDFAFDVGDDWETTSLSAEELFDGGVIKPLKPPPRLRLPGKARSNGSSVQKKSGSSPTMPPKSPISQGKKMIVGAFSPRHRGEYEMLRSPEPEKTTRRSPERQRGRERGPAGLSSSSRRATRSLSPMRVSQYPWEEEQSQRGSTKTQSSSIIVKPAANSAMSALASFSKKWRLKDFFLFRSASEGRAADKDPLKKYAAAFRRYEDVRISSNGARNINSPAGSSGSFSPRRKGHVSAHEMHYTVNKAVSDDLKKKTFLPYKQGILGRLAFNPAVHALANGFGLSHK